MGPGPIVVPLVALLIPIFFILLIVVFDAVFGTWAAYQLWHNRTHGHLKRILHLPR